MNRLSLLFPLLLPGCFDWLSGTTASGAAGTAVATSALVSTDLYHAVGAPGSGAGEVWIAAGAEPNVVSTSLTTATYIQLVGESAGDRFGAALTWADLDHTGSPDLVVGAPLAAGGGSQRGRVYVFLNAPDLCTSGCSIAASSADHVYQGAINGGQLGSSLAAPGEFLGTGVEVLAMGAPRVNLSRGAVFLLEVDLSAPSPESVSGAELVIVGEAPYDRAGTSLATHVDMDVDGRKDLVVGAPGADKRALNGGAAYVVAAGSYASKWLLLADETYLCSFEGESSSEALGTSVSGEGDFDADGLHDLGLGAPGYDGSGTNAGAAYVFLVPGCDRHYPSSLADCAVHGESAGDVLGTAVSFADADGTGAQNLLAGAPGHDEGTTPNAGIVYAYDITDGCSTFLEPVVNASLSQAAGTSGAAFGTAVAFAGDAGNDGYQEGIAGAPGANGGAGGVLVADGP